MGSLVQAQYRVEKLGMWAANQLGPSHGLLHTKEYSPSRAKLANQQCQPSWHPLKLRDQRWQSYAIHKGESRVTLSSHAQERRSFVLPILALHQSQRWEASANPAGASKAPGSRDSTTYPPPTSSITRCSLQISTLKWTGANWQRPNFFAKTQIWQMWCWLHIYFRRHCKNRQSTFKDSLVYWYQMKQTWESICCKANFYWFTKFLEEKKNSTLKKKRKKATTRQWSWWDPLLRKFAQVQRPFTFHCLF